MLDHHEPGLNAVLEVCILHHGNKLPQQGTTAFSHDEEMAGLGIDSGRVLANLMRGQTRVCKASSLPMTSGPQKSQVCKFRSAAKLIHGGIACGETKAKRRKQCPA